MKTCFIIVIICLMSPSCNAWEWDPLGIADPTDRAIAVLEKAIAELSDANADWQRILEESRDKLTSDTQSTIRIEVSNCIASSVAVTGAEARCEIDFVRKRARQDLARILAGLKNEEYIREPTICNTIPERIDIADEPGRRNVIKFYGYDLDTIPQIKAFIEYNDGNLLDISEHLHRPSNYSMVLDLGAGNTLLSYDCSRIMLTLNGNLLCDVPIVKPFCERQTILAQLSDITYIPPHTRGDRDFDGNGPEVTIDVRLGVDIVENVVVVTVHMIAKEPCPDYTTAEGIQKFTVYRPPPGYKIIGFLRSEDHFTYVDDDHGDDIFYRGSELVSRYTFVGDTDSDYEAGSSTGVTIGFNRAQIEIKQVKDCVNTIPR